MQMYKKRVNGIVFRLCWVLLLASVSFPQEISKGLIEKALKGIKGGKSYNEIITDTRIAIPMVADDVDNNQFSDGKNLAVFESIQDKIINPEEYYVGPGDVFLVYLWGKVEKIYTLAVTNEGGIIIPLLGVLNLEQKTLAETKVLIKEKMKGMYKNNVDIIVVLSVIRKFKTYVNGEVALPGQYLVNGVTRVSDVIEKAGGITKRGKYRGIKIVNELFETRYADLAIFNKSQDISKNQYLREGDRILVECRNERLTINGFVNYPGTYDYCQGDNVKDLLNATGGFSRGVDKDKIIISRFADDCDSLITFEIGEQQIEGFVLEKDDRILVCGIPEYRKHRQVRIRGEVKFPGVYPIRKDKTNLVDIIAVAGGLTEDAFLKGSKIVRRHYANVGNREFNRVKAMPSVSLTPMERNFLKTKLVEENGMVSIDFEELLRNGSDLYNIILRDRDEITVARKSLSIKVSGAVVVPGLLSFKEDVDYKYYIDQAGGFNTRAQKRNVMIIKGGTEVMLKPQKVKKLEAGDAIWVPEKEYRDRLKITKDILLILGSTATILISAFTIREAIK